MDVLPNWKKLKAVGVPWYYRNRLLNWLMAKPWLWHYRGPYLAFRCLAVDASGNEVLGTDCGRLYSAWKALTFPHVHHPNEDKLYK